MIARWALRKLLCLLPPVTAILVVSGGCRGPGARWTKPDMTEGEHARDSEACLNEASYTKTITIRPKWGKVRKSEVDYDLYRRCMEAKGYRQGDT